MIAGAMVIGGLTLVAAAVAFLAWLGRDLPARCDDILTLPQPGEDVQDAIDTGEAFDRAVDEALAVAKAGRTLGPVIGAYCSICATRFPATTIRDVAAHIRDIHGPTADHWAAWESELATPTRKDQP